MQHRLVGFVVKGHLVELNIAAQAAGVKCPRPVGNIRHRILQREDPLGRGNRLLHFRIHAGHLLDGPQHKGDIAHKRLDAAHRHAADGRLPAAIPGDGPHAKGADELHHRQEQGRKPGRAVAGAVHLLCELVKLHQVGLFPAERLGHAHAGDVLIVCAGDLGVGLAHHPVLHQDALLELGRHHYQDGDNEQHNQPQPHVDIEHEVGRGEDVHQPPANVQDTPGYQLGNAVGIGRDARHDPAHRGAAVVAERQRLQMVEQPLAQVVAHHLAQNAGEVDEAEDAQRLHDNQRAVLQQDAHQGRAVLGYDPFVDDALAEEGEVGI